MFFVLSSHLFFFLSRLSPSLADLSIREKIKKQHHATYLEQLGHLQKARVVVVPVALVPAVRLALSVTVMPRGLGCLPLGLFFQMQRLLCLEQVPRLVALALGRGQRQRERVGARPQRLGLGRRAVRARGVAVGRRLGLGEPAVALGRGGPRRGQLSASLVELVLQRRGLLRRRVARGPRVPVLVLQQRDVVVQLLRQSAARARLAGVRGRPRAEREQEQERERGAVPGEEAGDGVSLSAGCWCGGGVGGREGAGGGGDVTSERKELRERSVAADVQVVVASHGAPSFSSSFRFLGSSLSPVNILNRTKRLT